MADFDRLFVDLSTEIKTLRELYLAKYIPTKPEHTPEVFEHDVKSFCVLSHAGFEEFVELVSEEILSMVESEFQAKKISLATASLLLAYANRTSFSDDEAAQVVTCFDIVRTAIGDSKQKHSKAIAENHGFSPKYLRKMLQPVGINVPDDEVKLSSVKKLAEARGSFAHSRSKLAMYGAHRRATTPLTPEAALSIVDDCLEVCERIRDAAKSRW